MCVYFQTIKHPTRPLSTEIYATYEKIRTHTHGQRIADQSPPAIAIDDNPRYTIGESTLPSAHTTPPLCTTQRPHNSDPRVPGDAAGRRAPTEHPARQSGSASNTARAAPAASGAGGRRGHGTDGAAAHRRTAQRERTPAPVHHAQNTPPTARAGNAEPFAAAFAASQRRCIEHAPATPAQRRDARRCRAPGRGAR